MSQLTWHVYEDWKLKNILSSSTAHCPQEVEFFCILSCPSLFNTKDITAVIQGCKSIHTYDLFYYILIIIIITLMLWTDRSTLWTVILSFMYMTVYYKCICFNSSGSNSTNSQSEHKPDIDVQLPPQLVEHVMTGINARMCDSVWEIHWV